MFVIKHRSLFFVFSGLIVAASLIIAVVFGLRFGIDFTGGSLLEVEIAGSGVPYVHPSADEITGALAELNLGAIVVQPAGNATLLRLKAIDERTHQEIIGRLGTLGSPAGAVVEKRFTTIGPTVGKELRNKAIAAIILVSLAIVLFIAFAFRKVSKPVASWKYGVVAVITLLHDVTIPTGAFAVLGYLRGVEIDILFVTALLAILGYSVNDTIVVFDRIRENLRRNSEENRRDSFEETVGRSLYETYARSINTSLTVIIAILALFFFGAESTRYFSLALLIGVIAGTYSSIFIASPLLVVWEKWQRRG